MVVFYHIFLYMCDILMIFFENMSDFFLCNLLSSHLCFFTAYKTKMSQIHNCFPISIWGILQIMPAELILQDCIKLIILFSHLKISLRVITYRTHLRCTHSHFDMSTVSAFPDCYSRLLKNFFHLYVF